MYVLVKMLMTEYYQQILLNILKIKNIVCYNFVIKKSKVNYF